MHSFACIMLNDDFPSQHSQLKEEGKVNYFSIGGSIWECGYDTTRCLKLCFNENIINLICTQSILYAMQVNDNLEVSKEEMKVYYINSNSDWTCDFKIYAHVLASWKWYT